MKVIESMMKYLALGLIMAASGTSPAYGWGGEFVFLQEPATTRRPATQATNPQGQQQNAGRPSSPQSGGASASPQVQVGDLIRARNRQLQEQRDKEASGGASGASPQVSRTEPLQRRGGGSDRLALELEGSPIDTLIKFVMDELEYSYVIDPAVTGNVTIFMKGGVPREQIFEFLEQVLQMNGAAIIQRGPKFYAIVPLSEAPRIPNPLLIKPERPADPKGPEEKKGKTEKEEKKEKKKKNGSGQEKNDGGGPESEPSAAGNLAARTLTPPGAPAPLAPQQQQPPQQGQQPPQAGVPRRLGQSAEAAQIDQERGVITYVIPLNFISASEFIKMAQVYLSEGATVVDFAPSNMLLITDYRRNIQQVLNLVNLLDTEYFDLNDIALLPIRYNNAVDIAEDLGKVFSADDEAAGVRIVAIERLNSLLVVTHGASVLQDVRRWIGRLDTPSSSSNIKTFIYQVENNTADNIATILGQLYEDGFGLPSGGSSSQRQQGQANGGQRSGSGRTQDRGRQRQQAGFTPDNGLGRSNQQQAGTLGGRGGFGGQGQRGGGFGQGAFGQAQSLGPSLRGRPSAAEGIRSVVSGSVKIIVNEFNNSLIIQATEADYQYLLGTIKQLDTLPRQVEIQAEIYRVTLTDNLEFGITAFLEGRAGDAGVATTGSINPGFTGASRTIIGQSRQLRGILTALRARTNVKVLDNPRILTMDGVQATINIGAEIPVSTSSFSDPLQSGNTGFINQIQFRPTGTTLLIIPRISASGIVNLELSLEVSQSSTAGTDSTNLTPTINRSLIETTLLVRDGQSIAMGGIITESETFNRDRVPVLGDIPVLGALFGNTRREKSRSELIFLITPKVVATLPTAAEMTLEFQRALRSASDYIDKKRSEREELIRKRREEHQKRRDN